MNMINEIKNSGDLFKYAYQEEYLITSSIILYTHCLEKNYKE